jgi:hypothetical protein
MNKLITNGFIFIIFWPSVLTAEPHTNLQSHYCHTYQDVSECSNRCVNYYERQITSEEEILNPYQFFYRFRYDETSQTLIEQRAKIVKGSTQKPQDQDFEDFITVDYCSEFSFIDINNWVCIEDLNPETNLTFRLGMTEGRFYLINEEAFENAQNKKIRENQRQLFLENGSTFLECMK